MVFGIATCMILLTTTQRTLIGLTEKPLPLTRLRSFVADAAHWYLWAAAAFPIYWIALRLAVKNNNRAFLFFAHLLLAFVFGLLNIVLQSGLISLLFDEPLVKNISPNFYVRLAMRVAFYYLIVIACSVVIEHKRRKEEELKARNLETRLALAQFQVLKSQLNPDFLLETLQSISNLMRKDIEAADRLTARLGDFLRLSLESSCAGYVPLQEEVELVKTYVDIRRFSHPDLHLIVRLDPHFIGTLVPSRVLLDPVQTLAPVEKLEISTAEKNGHLSISVAGLERPDQQLASRERPFPWRYENQKLLLDVPLLMNVQEDQPAGETFFQSLEDFHRSIAQKERTMQNSKPSSRRRFWVTLGVWTLAGLFFFSTEIMTRFSNRQPLLILETLRDSLAWYWWAILTPLIFFLARKFPLRPGSLKKSAVVHLLSSATISFSMAFLYMAQRWIFQLDVTAETVRDIVLRYPYLFDALTYWAIVGVHEGLLQRWQYLQEDVRTAKLKGNLMEAQVQALKMQLHPHFLFNALNSISELMHEDLRAAGEMLNRLADFLRLTFQSSDVQEITLQNELGYLRNYLDIQQVRFQNRLRIELKIDPEAMQDRVPNLILQPIVENAIRHGVSPRIDSGKVEIRAFHREGNLFLEVEDDGPGLKSGSFREGIGMSNTRMRLKQIYGTECRFGIQNNPKGGLVVTMQIPSTELRQPHGTH